MAIIEFLPLIVALIQVIILIVFFIMANNVSKMKRQIVMNAKKYIEEGDMEAYVGNKEKAKEYYLKAKYRIEVLKDYSNINDNNNKPYPGMSKADINNKIEERNK